MWVSIFYLLFVIQTDSEVLILSGQVQATDPQRLLVPMGESWQMKLEWFATEGKMVESGEAVIRFDSTAIVTRIEELELQLVQLLETEKQKTSQMQLEREEAEFELLQAQMEFDKAQLDLTIPDEWVIPLERDKQKLTLERCRRRFDDAKMKREHKIQAQKEALETIKLDKSQILTTLRRKRANLERMTLYADYAGPVIHHSHPWQGTKFQEGDSVSPSWVIAEIPSDKGLHIKAFVSEVDVHRIAVGQVVQIFFDALKEERRQGTIQSIAASADVKRHWGKGSYFDVIVEADPALVSAPVRVTQSVEAGNAPGGDAGNHAPESRTRENRFIAGMSVQLHVVVKPKLEGLRVSLDEVISNGGFFTLRDDPAQKRYRLNGYSDFFAYLELLEGGTDE